MDIFETLRDWHDNGDKIILFAGNLVADKGCDRLLEALRRLPSVDDYPVRLLVAGDGCLRRRLQRRAQRLISGDRVIFAGSYPQSAITLLMNLADCLCLPSRSEGMPNVVSESLASGLPVVATAVGEVPHMIRDGENGYCVSNGPNVAEELAQALRKALTRPWNRAQLAAAAPKPSWDDAAEMVLSGVGHGT